MVRSGSPLQRRLFLFVLPILLQVSPHTLWGGENNPHPQKVSSQQVRTLARGPFTLPLENNGVIVSTKGNYLRWYGQDLVTGAALMVVGKDSTGALHSSLGGPYTDSENQAGVLTAPYTGNSSVAANPADPRFRIYAIQRTDATGGGNLDYDQWPADQGAPVGTDGKPLFLGDQEFFFVYNDLATLSRSPGGLPFGIEVRVLGWWDDQIPLLSGTFFYRFQILNKSIFAYDSIFVGVWADPDIGSEYHDDFVGCDITLRLLYAYKDVEQDPSAYGMSPPSVGFVFLGIEQPGGLPGKNLFHFVPITRASGGDFPDVGLHSLDFHQLVYNYLRGLGARGQTVVNPLTGLGSTSVFPGDPVTGLGWLPKNSGFTPTDYRMMGSCGPLRMAPGDTQTVTVALIAAQGQDRLGSVAQLRFIAEQIRAAFASSTQPAINAEPSWWMEYPSGSPPRAHVTVNTAGIQTCTAEFFDGQGQTILSSLMTGSGTFSTVSELPPALRPAYGDLIALRPQGGEVRYRGAFNRLSTAARPEQRRLQVTYDQSNGDLIANPGELIELSMSLFNGSLWTFDSLTLEPSFLSATRAFKSMSFRGLPSGQETPLPEAIAATVDGSSGEIGQAILPFVLVDHIWSNRWYDTLRIPVQPFNYLPKPVYPIHVSGKSSRTPLISLVNPSGWKDHEYSITFPLSIYNVVVVDMTTNDSLVRNQSFGPYVYYSPRVLQPGDAGRLVIDGFKLLPGNIGSADVEMRELCGPGGIVLESEPYERNARFGRDLRKERENSTNRYRLSDVSLSYDNPIIELRTTERGSKYYVGLSPDTAIRLAPNRVPFEIWNLGGTPDDPSDDKQLTVIVFDGDRDGRFTASESIIGTQMYAYSESPPESHQVINWFFDRNIVLRFKPASGDQFALPEEGAVLRFYWSVPVGPDDIYLVRPAQASLPPPSSVFLFNNFPNPFNPTTTIKFYLPVKSKVKVTVYDLLGAEVAVLLDEERDVGEHYAFWGGKNRSGMSVASGVYLYRVSTPSTTTAGKMILLR